MQDYRDYKTIFNLTFNHNNKFLNLVSNTYINGRTDTSWPPQFLFGHLFLNITNVFCAKNGWGMLVYAPGWSLASQF